MIFGSLIIHHVDQMSSLGRKHFSDSYSLFVLIQITNSINQTVKRFSKGVILKA